MCIRDIDDFVDIPFSLLSSVVGDVVNPNVEDNYSKIIKLHSNKEIVINKIDRFDFYKKSKSVFAIVATGDAEKYANIILKKGVTPS